MSEDYLGIKIDLSRDSNFDELGLKRLKESYMREDEDTPQKRYAFVAKTFGSNPEHAQRLYDYASKHWLGFSTPILSYGRTKKGLPISCFLAYIPDSAEGLVESLSETNWLSMLGGGVGLGVGMRSSSEKSTGVMAHMKTYDSCSLAYRQGTTRRGSYAAYLDISHPDIINFMEMRKPTGDPNIRCLNMHNAVMIPDSFMQIIERCMVDPNADDSWDLIDPASKEVRETVSAKYLWQLLLELRMMTGEPYLMFIDTANNALPREQYNKGLRIRQSNICCLTGDTEIVLSRFKEGDYDFVESLETFVQKYNSGVYSDGIWVKSWNVESGEVEWNLVQGAKHSGDVDVLYEITSLEFGRVLKSTTEHKFYTMNRGWVEAHDLKSDLLVLSGYISGDCSKNYITLTDTPTIRKIDVDKIPVYDISVEGVNNFFANNILVHNSEITLPTDKDRTAVCCLSSVNMYKYDEYKEQFNQLISDVAEMLDNVLTKFIEEASDTIERAKYSAMMERAIGIGVMGYHSYLQSKSIPFESVAAKIFNKTFFKTMKEYADAANLRLGKERGEAPDMAGSGKRFSHSIAIAPTATNAIISGNISPSIEPLRANVFRQDTLSGSFIHRNHELEKVLLTKGVDMEETWNSIVLNDGSVQHLTCLTDDEKEVFKTAIEIDQRWIIEKAGDRQKFIDQGQSVNLFFKPDTSVKYLHAIHFLGWKAGLKTLYYCRSEKIKKANKISQRIDRKRIEDIDIKALVDGESCIACE
jgi:ribonucleotide reductase alpha subunit